MKGHRLAAYLRSRVASQVLALLFMITALMQVLQLLDVTTDILKRGQGARGLLYYSLLQTPGELVLALPLAVLLGAMMALGAMARHSEITAIRVSGLSITRIFGHLLPLALVLAVVQFVLSEQAVPRAETALKEWWTKTALPADPDADAPKTLWARSSNGMVSIESASADGRHLTGVQQYTRDANGLLTTLLKAARAEWDGRGWALSDVTELHLATGSLQQRHDDARRWDTNVRPEDVLRLDVARPHLSSIMLAEVIVGARVATQPRSYYTTVLYRSFSQPLGILVMLLLALPTACPTARASKGREMFVALALGLGFLLCDGILASLGTSGRYPPLAVALAAPLLFGAIGVWQLRAYERA
jgi:lipopolysaccharide export system permease protein